MWVKALFILLLVSTYGQGLPVSTGVNSLLKGGKSSLVIGNNSEGKVDVPPHMSQLKVIQGDQADGSADGETNNNNSAKSPTSASKEAAPPAVDEPTVIKAAVKMAPVNKSAKSATSASKEAVAPAKLTLIKAAAKMAPVDKSTKSATSASKETVVPAALAETASNERGQGEYIDSTQPSSTTDQWYEFCKAACEAGMAGDECDCADFPFNNSRQGRSSYPSIPNIKQEKPQRKSPSSPENTD